MKQSKIRTWRVALPQPTRYPASRGKSSSPGHTSHQRRMRPGVGATMLRAGGRRIGRGALGMALSFPIDLSRNGSLGSFARGEGGELSNANATYRSLDGGIIDAEELGLVHWDVVAGSWTIAETVDEIEGLLRSVDLGSVLATGLMRDAEVSDARIAYGTLDRDQANARLAELGIIVRPAVTPPETA